MHGFLCKRRKIMEIKEVIIFVVVFMVFILIVTIRKSRKIGKTGFKSLTGHTLFNLKIGIMKIDGSIRFSVIIENVSSSTVTIKDIYLEIKEAARYQKHPLPASSFDNSKLMQIPEGKQGGAFLSLKEFKRLFNEDSIFKVVVEDNSSGQFKSQIMSIDLKKMILELK